MTTTMSARAGPRRPSHARAAASGTTLQRAQRVAATGATLTLECVKHTLRLTQYHRRSRTGRSVYRLHQGDAPATLATVAQRRRARLNRRHEVLEHAAVAANVRHHGRGRARVRGLLVVWRCVDGRPQLHRDHPVPLDDDRSLRARELEPAWQTGECRGRRLARPHGAVREPGTPDPPVPPPARNPRRAGGG